MTSAKETSRIEVAKIVTPEVKNAAAQAVLSEGPIEVSIVLHKSREETLAIVQRLLASAGIEGTFSTPKTDKTTQVIVELRENEVPVDKELAAEEAWFNEFKARFNDRPELHPGEQWADVEESLKADPEAVRKIKLLDAAGFIMNVFRSKNNGEIKFRSTQTNVNKIAQQYRKIVYNKAGLIDYPEKYRPPNGNAEDLAVSLGVELATEELYNQLPVETGWVWLKTDNAMAPDSYALNGRHDGVYKSIVGLMADEGSFCPVVTIEKVHTNS